MVYKIKKESMRMSGKLVKIVFEGSGKLQVVSSQYHPEFGLSIDNKQLIYTILVLCLL